MTKRSVQGLAAIAACVALLVAMVGASSAAAQSNNSKQASISKKHKAKRGPRGKRGAKGATGATGPAGAKGATGPAGPAGTAKAYATVDSLTVPEFLEETLHPGFVAVSRPEGVPTGVYCLTPASGISVAHASPIASVEWGSSSGFDLLVEPLSEAFECPETTLEVRTYDFAGGTVALSNDVSFTVLLP
jgi:hypothetical protein